ncbi:hypothetical protein [Flavobacterium sp. JP2137]|uniref:hypothetical protein n=1 Tax=Flavobacterium sp. JP2137 TaxID=3414510 RepID=UPI003D3006FA
MKHLLFLIPWIMTVTNSRAQVAVGAAEAAAPLAFFVEQLEIPAEFSLKQVSLVRIDQVEAYLFRAEKSVNSGLLGEHFSFLVSKKQPFRILGFTRMDSKYLNKPQLSEGETRTIAVDFLRRVDSNLADNVEHLWTDKHGEPLEMGGEAEQLVGMKYKCFRKSARDYAWVIVGFDGSIVTFERDIIWDSGRKKRQTKQWLSDSWQLNNAQGQGDVTR